MEMAYVIAGIVGVVILLVGWRMNKKVLIVIGVIILLSVLVIVKPILPEATMVLLSDIAAAFKKFGTTVF